MNPVSRKIVSLFLVVLVLFSNMSFAVNMHFCGDHLVGTAILGTAKTCGMETENVLEVSDCSVTKKSCCTNQQVIVQGQDHIEQNVPSSLTPDQQQFLISFLYNYTNGFSSVEYEKEHFQECPPPLGIRDIYKLHEVYLI